VSVSTAYYWKLATLWGTFTIMPTIILGERRFELRLDGTRIDNYRSPDIALKDLVDPDVFWFLEGLDSTHMELLPDFSGWEFISPASDGTDKEGVDGDQVAGMRGFEMALGELG
jgi:hypothetical protein